MNKPRILVGDCREVLAEMEPESFDACVTDPPYHLASIVKRFGSTTAAPAQSNGATGVYGRASKGFMGQTWDGGDVAMDPATWAAVWRVLKPGAHLIALCGTRTEHRVVCAIEDAGFEIRDRILWLYGSGFPKSHDVSKAIDRAARGDLARLKITHFRIDREWTQEQLGRVCGFADPAKTVWDWEDGGHNPGDSNWLKARDALGVTADEEATFEREVLGSKTNGASSIWGNGSGESLITAPATDAARQWQGWGTALKPAVELAIWATRPLTSVPSCALLAEVTASIEALLWSLSSAKTAELLSTSSPSECVGECGSVRLLAAVLDMLSSRGASELMATFRSPEEGSTSLSIALLWNAILGASCENPSTFTIETVSNLTTSLRIWNSWISATTPDNIIQAAIRHDGLWCDASDVSGISRDWRALFRSIQPPSAHENAGKAMATALLSELASIADRTSALHQDIIANIVHKRALTDLITPQSVSDERMFALNVADLLRLTPPELQSIADAPAWPSLIESRLSPNCDLAVLARKPLSEGTVAANVLRHGTGALNIDGTRVGTDESLNGGAYSGQLRQRDEYQSADSAPGAVPLSRLNRGAGEFVQPNGRWPANVAHDGSPEVLQAFARYPVHGAGAARAGSENPRDSLRNGSVPIVPATNTGDMHRFGDTGTAARFFKACPFEPDELRFWYGGKANSYERAGSPHPTIKPIALMEWLVTMITPPNGLVIDPFCGSGSTLIACERLGFESVGIELREEAAKDAERRCEVFRARRAIGCDAEPEQVLKRQLGLDL